VVNRVVIYVAYNNYMAFGYPEDELDPIACKGKSRNNDPNDWAINDVLLGSSLTLIDSLGTLAIMGKQKEFEKAIRLVIDEIDFSLDARVQVFEITIRVLGGILSAHLLATDEKIGFAIPWYKGELLAKAVDLAERLMPAFNTPYSLPFPRVNLEKGVIEDEVREACTAGAGTLILEFGTLSRLTGNYEYENAAKKVSISYKAKSLGSI
jgi:mannosidase alpha-like ER degradation enhancer 1